MPSRMRTRTSFSRGPRPRYVWVAGNDQQETTPAASVEASDDLLLNYAADVGRDTGPGFVIERIFGTLIIEPQAVNTLLPIMCGLVVSTEGSGVTITPKTEAGRFLWFHQDECSREASEVAADVFIPKQKTIYFETKARFRMDNVGDELHLIMQNDAADQVLTWSVYTRTLLRVT